MLHRASKNIQKYIFHRWYSVKSKLQTTICPFTIVPRRNRLVHRRYLVKSKLCNVTDLSALYQVGFSQVLLQDIFVSGGLGCRMEKAWICKMQLYFRFVKWPGESLFFWPEPVAFRRVYGTWDLLVYHVTIAAPYPGGIDPRLAVYARSWDRHYTTTRRDRLKRPGESHLALDGKKNLLHPDLPFGWAMGVLVCFQVDESVRFFHWCLGFIKRSGPPRSTTSKVPQAVSVARL